MKRILRFTIFFTVFTSVFFLMNYYVLGRLSGLFGIQKDAWFYALLGFATLGFIVTRSVERAWPNLLTRVIHTISATWMGIVFFFLTTLIVYEFVEVFIYVPAKTAGIFVLGLVGAVSAISLINAAFLSVKEIYIKIGLKNGLRIVQLSDMHIGTIRNSGFMKRIVKKVNATKPDAVMITGDLVDGSAPLRKGMFDTLNGIKAPMFFVTGNHETYEGVDKVMDILKTVNMTILRNEVKTFKGVQIVGVDYVEDRQLLSKVLPKMKISKSKPSILLYHPPREVDVAREHGIDLMLSGHTHNGQIFPFNFLVRTEFKYMEGLYDVGTKIYVSPGTGTWGPPMRLGSRNEVTVLNLKS